MAREFPSRWVVNLVVSGSQSHQHHGSRVWKNLCRGGRCYVLHRRDSEDRLGGRAVSRVAMEASAVATADWSSSSQPNVSFASGKRISREEDDVSAEIGLRAQRLAEAQGSEFIMASCLPNPPVEFAVARTLTRP